TRGRPRTRADQHCTRIARNRTRVRRAVAVGRHHQHDVDHEHNDDDDQATENDHDHCEEEAVTALPLPLLTRTRRRAELSLGLLVIAVTVGGYILVALANGPQLPADLYALLAAVFGLYLVAHLAVRRFAPAADGTLLPLVAMLNGIGFVTIARLDKTQ